MVFFSYGASDVLRPLPPPLAAYLATASPKQTAQRHAALSLLCTLAEQAAIPLDYPIALTKEGKPFFDSAIAPYFSLSHSGGSVSCAIGHSPVGIDLQEELPSLETTKLATRFFGEKECALAANAPRETFFEIWTKKEALGKCLGTGLPPLLGQETDTLAQKNGLVFTTVRVCLADRFYTLTLCAAEQARLLFPQISPV